MVIASACTLLERCPTPEGAVHRYRLDLIQVPFSCDGALRINRSIKYTLAVKMWFPEWNRFECRASQNSSFLAMAKNWDLSQV